MAITRQTVKDIGNYAPKAVGPFTIRQAVCIGVGLVPTYFVDQIVLGITGGDITATFVASAITMAIPVFLAFGSKVCYGMNPEVFLKEMYRTRILSSKIRKYETVTEDDIIWAKGKTSGQNDSPETSSNSKITISGTQCINYKHKEDKNTRTFA